MNITVTSTLRRGFCIGWTLLALISCLPGCSREIPVLVSIRGTNIEGVKFTLTPTLAEVPQKSLKLNEDKAQTVLYLPAEASGKLKLAVHGEDAQGCIVEGVTEVDVTPVGNGALEAVIEIDPQKFPSCKLSVTVGDHGSVSALEDKQFYCPDQGGSRTCEVQIRKDKTLTLVGKEASSDFGQDVWLGDCAAATEQCVVTASRSDLKVKTTFSKQACSPGGTCSTAVGADSGRRVSSNGLWVVGKDQALYTRKDERWDRVAPSVIFDQVQAIWAAEKVAWVVTKNIIWQCSVSKCDKQHIIDTPRALYGFGGDSATNPSFWVADKSTIYRCAANAPSCTITAITDLALEVEQPSPRILNITADTGDQTIVSGTYSKDGSCTGFVRYCTGKKCVQALNWPLDPCPSAGSFRFREEVGSSQVLWVYQQDQVGIARAEPGYWLPSKKMMKFPITASVGAATLQSAWVIGESGNVLFYDLKKRAMATAQPISTNLNAVWMAQSGNAWVAGDKGEVLLCDKAGPSCLRYMSPPNFNLDVIHGDGSGKVWAISQEAGKRVSCQYNLASCKVDALDVP